MSDRILNKSIGTGMLGVSGLTGNAQYIQDPIIEGLVVDVIVDQDHPECSDDGYNIGMIKIRNLAEDHGVSDAALSWARPYDTTIIELPLIGELVTLVKIRGALFYHRKIAIAHTPQENAMLNANSALNGASSNTLSAKTNTRVENVKDKHKFGDYFKADDRVRQLKLFEGDVLIQGRMGQSIRLGSSRSDLTSEGIAPAIVLRTGQASDLEETLGEVTHISPYGRILENILNDASSIYMTSDSSIPFIPATALAGAFARSCKIPLFKGAQIILTSDTIALNAKETNIMLFANNDIYLNSLADTVIDTDENIKLTANLDISARSGRMIEYHADSDFKINSDTEILITSRKKISAISEKIYIGSLGNQDEPMVGGKQLSYFLSRLILCLMGGPAVPPQIAGKSQLPPVPVPAIHTFSHVLTPVGPGVLSPSIVTNLTKLYTELALLNSGQKIPQLFAGAPFNSTDNFVALSNDVITDWADSLTTGFKPGKRLSAVLNAGKKVNAAVNQANKIISNPAKVFGSLTTKSSGKWNLAKSTYRISTPRGG